MSGRHKPLMHVIFLFHPTISPAFPHRSLLSPNHFKNRIYFCLKNHALSLLIQGVRLHWDSKHTSSLNKFDIHFSPTRRYLLTNQVWLGVVTCRVSFGENMKAWREIIDHNSLTVARSKQYLDAHIVHSTELCWRQSWTHLSCFFGSYPWTRCSYAKLALPLPAVLGRLPSAQHWRFPPARDTC